jgi:hypothetical protein
MIAGTANVGRVLGLPSARQLAYGVAFLSLGAIVVGCFLPVADEASVNFDRIDGNSLRPSGIGWLTLSLCGLMAISLIRSLYRGERTWGPLIVGFLVLAQTVYVGAAELTTCPVGANLADPCQTASPGLGLFMIGAGGAALALAGIELASWRPGRPRASAPVRHDIPERATTDAPPPLVLEAEPLTAADVASYVAAIRSFAEETARQIIADAHEEAALIRSAAALESRALETTNAERQLRLAEAAATARVERLHHASLAVQEHLGNALRELAAVRQSALTRPSATPRERQTVSAGHLVGRSHEAEQDDV